MVKNKKTGKAKSATKKRPPAAKRPSNVTKPAFGLPMEPTGTAQVVDKVSQPIVDEPLPVVADAPVHEDLVPEVAAEKKHWWS